MPVALEQRQERGAGRPPGHAAERGGGLVTFRWQSRRGRWLGWSTRVHVRAIWVTAVLAAGALVVFFWSLSVGDSSVPIPDVIRGVFVAGGDHDFTIRTLRLPRGLTALAAGAAFGLSGAILQRLAGNPLASPDIVGINAGAAFGAVSAIAFWEGSGAQVTWAAVAGAGLTAVAVYLLAYRKGVTGYRLVLVGIGLAAVMQALTRYLVSQVETYDAQRAAVWLAGSLYNRGWDEVRPLVMALLVLVPAAVALARHLRMLELGDDAAKALGARAELARGALLAVAVGLAAAGVASAGPITFVALAAPQIARRLVGPRSLALLPAAAAGALLLVAADLAARRALAPRELPVGVMTGILGAPYLLYLLARASKIGRAG